MTSRDIIGEFELIPLAEKTTIILVMTKDYEIQRNNFGAFIIIPKENDGDRFCTSDSDSLVFRRVLRESGSDLFRHLRPAVFVKDYQLTAEKRI